MRLGCFITTYDRPSVLSSTIEQVLSQTRPPDVFAVVDNGEDPRTSEVVAQFPGVHHVRTGENLGSAGGCSYGIELLYLAGCDWMMSLDDDDPLLTGDTIQRIEELIQRRDSPRLGAVAAVGQLWNWRAGRIERVPDSALEGDVQVDVIGGNVALTVSRRAVELVGAPDKSLFFGFYDPLYSLQLKQAGLELWIDGDLMRSFRRATGRLGYTSSRSLVPRDPEHAVWRRYYVSRNYIAFMRGTLARPDLARREAARGVIRSLTAFVRGPRYGMNYARLQLRGIAHGYRGRLGRTVLPRRKPHFDAAMAE